MVPSALTSMTAPSGPGSRALGLSSSTRIRPGASITSLLVDNGEAPMYEHSETWTWDTGDTVLLRFVSVHKVVDDKITLWKDYWDYVAIMNNAPESWLTAVAEGDLSWIYGATGEI